MSISLEEIAQLVDGTLTGDGAVTITGVGTIRDACEGDITLADKPELARQLAESAASAAIVAEGFQPEGIAYITVGDVHQAFARVVAHFRPPRVAGRIGVSPAAHVSESASFGEDCDVHAGATVGDDVTIGTGSTLHAGAHVMAGCRLGRNVTLFPGAVLYENTVVGDNVIIHANAVLGAYGFGYATVDGAHRLSAQLGNVVVEDDVEIGAGSTVDRGTYGPTFIGRGTKIDNLVMIAHNCRIGRHNVICSQVGIAGSTTTGDYVVMAGQVGVRDHVHIGDQAVLGAMAGVMNNVPAGATYVGIPATPERVQLHQIAALSKLPEMRKTLRRLERTVREMAPPEEPADAQDAA